MKFGLILLMHIIHLKVLYIMFKDLENYIRNHPESRLEKIQEIGKQLIDSNIMTHSIETDVEGLTNRWENLNKQVCILSTIHVHVYH